MKKINICAIGYTAQYKKFLSHIIKNTTKYKLKLIYNNSEKFFNIQQILSKIKKEKIKIIALCGEDFIAQISSNINFFIENKIKIVQASNNEEVSNHGFIIEKPFRDYSFEQLFLRETLKFSYNLNNKLFNNKKILITGGAGSIGSGLVKEILKFDIKKIYILDSSEHNIFKLKNSIEEGIRRKKIEYSLANIENKKILDIIFNKFRPDIVFHAAALKHVIFLENNIREGILTNIIGTQNVIAVSIKFRVKYFIHVSTDKAAEPKTILGYTKFLSEEVCKKYSRSKTAIGIVRFGNVFNSYGSVAEKFKSQIINSKKIQLSHPKVERFFMSVNEATSLILSTLEIISKDTKKKCRTFICDMGEQVKIIDLAKKMLFLSGRNPELGISNKFYGLNKIEKISEKLYSPLEKIISNPKNRIYEIEQTKKRIYINNIIKLIYGKFDNRELKLKLKYLAKTSK